MLILIQILVPVPFITRISIVTHLQTFWHCMVDRYAGLGICNIIGDIMVLRLGILWQCMSGFWYVPLLCCTSFDGSPNTHFYLFHPRILDNNPTALEEWRQWPKQMLATLYGLQISVHPTSGCRGVTPPQQIAPHRFCAPLPSLRLQIIQSNCHWWKRRWRGSRWHNMEIWEIFGS